MNLQQHYISEFQKKIGNHGKVFSIEPRDRKLVVELEVDASESDAKSSNYAQSLINATMPGMKIITCKVEGNVARVELINTAAKHLAE